MFRSFTILTTAVVISINSVSLADDDLFTEFQPGAVFASESADESKKATTALRVTSAESLRELLKAGSFDAKVSSPRSVTASKELDPWTFPVMAIIAEDESSITLVLGLTTIKDVSKELPAETLLKMMKASQENLPALFAYHSGRERTEVSVTLKNRDLTGQTLRDEINGLAILAKENADVWASKDQKAAVSTPSASIAQAPVAANLTGKWSAAKSEKEAFGVEFKEDGSFNLVYINNSQQTKSSGRFEVTTGSLTLSGSDGLKLQGKLTITSGSEFRFEPKNSTILVFKKAK